MIFNTDFSFSAVNSIHVSAYRSNDQNIETGLQNNCSQRPHALDPRAGTHLSPSSDKKSTLECRPRRETRRGLLVWVRTFGDAHREQILLKLEWGMNLMACLRSRIARLRRAEGADWTLLSIG
ncbi:hypothetical protein MVEN_00010800 [Mycena venus]|uniref:Uncharacterized protein n=1 Tax=Mycena venus TaxID=2733690 RepID=A0A8H6Z3D5_9AGAR|nr:hypothetical protein MVEN_00010800 [Mycena venus]